MKQGRKRWDKPEDFHPALKMERLELIASILRFVQDRAAETFKREDGDTEWNHGCTAFERCRTVLQRTSEQIDWLGVHDGSRHFVFLIDGHPIRFSKAYGEDKPSPNVLLRDEDELEKARQSFIAGFEPLAKYLSRFIVHRIPEDHRVRQVDFSVFDATGKPIQTWPIRSDLAVGHLLENAPIHDLKADVEDPEFEIEKKKREKKKKNN